MIPAWVVALFSFTTGAFLMYEARKKNIKLYRDRWMFMSLPFFYEAAIYLWVELFNPDVELRAQFIRGGYFSIIFAATLYFIQDLIVDAKDYWRRRGR